MSKPCRPSPLHCTDSGERPVAPVYVDGEKTVTLKGETIAEDFQRLVDRYVRETYGPDGRLRRGGAAAPRKQIPIKAAS